MRVIIVAFDRCINSLGICGIGPSRDGCRKWHSDLRSFLLFFQPPLHAISQALFVIIAKSRPPNSYPSSGLSIVLSVNASAASSFSFPLQFLRAAVHVLPRQPYHCSIGLAKLGTRSSIGPSILPSTMHPTQPSSARSQTKSSAQPYKAESSTGLSVAHQFCQPPVLNIV